MGRGRHNAKDYGVTELTPGIGVAEREAREALVTVRKLFFGPRTRVTAARTLAEAEALEFDQRGMRRAIAQEECLTGKCKAASMAVRTESS